MAKSEQWLPVVGHEDVYEVSNLGRVRSLDRVIYANHPCGRVVGQPHKGKTLRLVTDRDGYLQVSLYKDAAPTRGKVHRMVCEAFLGRAPEGKSQVAHFDGDPTNNRVENLRWADATDNTADKMRHGRVLVREKHPRAKITMDDAKEIVRLRGEGVTYREISERFGIHTSTAHSIISGRNWQGATNG